MRINRRLATAVIASLLWCSSVVVTSADMEECQSAIDQLRSAKSDWADSLKGYADCLESSDGHDDCSTEFSRLRSDQDDFESAVSQYGDDCSD